MKCKLVLNRIAARIQEREDFIATLSNLDNPPLTSDFSHEFYLVDWFEEGGDEIGIVFCNFWHRDDNDRDFYKYNHTKGTLVDVDEDTDERYRDIDDENPYMEREEDYEFILRRDELNEIHYFEGYNANDK
jgi:hypothetical protein